MKAEITQNKKAFEPIEVKINIESLEELNDLCARLYMHYSDVNKYMTDSYEELITEEHSYKLWKLLDNLYAKQFYK